MRQRGLRRSCWFVDGVGKLAGRCFIVLGQSSRFNSRETDSRHHRLNRECQTKAYPPHKRICGTTLRSLDLSLAPSSSDDDTPAISSTKASLSLPLYTSTPTPALLLQLLFLKKDEESDYNYILSTPTGPGRYPMIIPTTSLRTIFLEARAKALGEGDKASIGVMDLILRSAGVLPRGTAVNGITTQLEGEFEVDMMVCRAATLDKEGVSEGVRTALNLND